MFCIKCGKQLSDEMKYCPSCGEKNGYDIDEPVCRKISYDGKIHKCPNCGEILDSFISNCTTCGFELRDVRTSDTIKEFFDKIETVKSDEEKVILVLFITCNWFFLNLLKYLFTFTNFNIL